MYRWSKIKTKCNIHFLAEPCGVGLFSNECIHQKKTMKYPIGCDL